VRRVAVSAVPGAVVIAAESAATLTSCCDSRAEAPDGQCPEQGPACHSQVNRRSARFRIFRYRHDQRRRGSRATITVEQPPSGNRAGQR
jgi:hypothetical protein